MKARRIVVALSTLALFVLGSGVANAGLLRNPIW